MKVCTKCNKEKELSEFYKHPNKKSGVSNNCKDCEKDYSRNRYANNRKSKKWRDETNAKQRENYKYNSKKRLNHGI